MWMNICKVENTYKINNPNSSVVLKTKTINKFRRNKEYKRQKNINMFTKQLQCTPGRLKIFENHWISWSYFHSYYAWYEHLI